MTNSLNSQNYDELIDRIARRICDLKLETIFIIILESAKPLSFIASSILVAFEPLINSFFSFKDYKKFYEMLENRENIEKLIRKIEEYSQEK
ncbi:MAG: hypothetical protein ABDH37_03635 [Candidatus Hydrothermales bacterium]